jgi:hypothetical protein
MDQRNTIKESNLDKKYREMLVPSLGDIKESRSTRAVKYEFACPFCSAQRKGAKKNSKCSALFWVEARGCFRFRCFNGGSVVCSDVLEFPAFLKQLKPSLFREYQLERFHEGTTGDRWNCADPDGVLEVLKGHQ